MSVRAALKNTHWCKCMKNITHLPSSWALGNGPDGFVIMDIWRQQLGWSARRFEHDEKMKKIVLQWDGVKPDVTRKSMVKHVFPAGCVYFNSCKQCPKRQ